MTSILKVDNIKDSANNQAISISSGVVTFANAAVNAGVGGKVLQVVSNFSYDNWSTNSTSLVAVTGASVSITPSATTSKILIMAHMTGFYMVGGHGSSGDDGASGSIFRNSTNIYGKNRFAYNRDTSAGSQELAIPLVLTFLDSPSSTSALTYAIYMKAYSGSTLDSNGYDRTITCIEIGA